MLTTSSALECLILQDSSPSTAAPSWATYIHLDTLCELHLINLNPLYACALLHTLHTPALHHLHLKLFNQDFTPLTELLTAPPSPPSPGTLIDPTCPYISHLHNCTHDSDVSALTPMFPELSELAITASECTLTMWCQLLVSMHMICKLAIDFHVWRLSLNFFDILLEPLPPVHKPELRANSQG
ncbi:hypothetical protein AcW1_003312 [Taiwanofungus camphoratus]|nr:hypothetical protein AcW1_003312 [Antrodia cinnamomea]KAI0944088.1 hypothetical protein AcV7_002006 [Antrodia cinnamomea]